MCIQTLYLQQNKGQIDIKLGGKIMSQVSKEHKGLECDDKFARGP